jgi:prepilin-type N-terminal cleavage/methylation domain-containing protein/prepilin-type processing-associated H-X9-DG protein
MEQNHSRPEGPTRAPFSSARLRAFTLVELLVVIAIIGILVALLLPAIQAARESARRMTCSNNLKQMGIALHGYHDSKKQFPIGVAGGRVSRPEEGYGWAVALLPYLEEQTLYDQMNPDWEPAPCRRAFNTTGKIVPGGETALEVFRCPSSEMPQHYAEKTDFSDDLAIGYATSDYKGCNGSDAAGTTGHGIFCTVRELWNNNSRTKLAIKDVIDGVSKTIAIGESAYYSLREDDDINKWPAWIGGIIEDESTLFKTNEDNPIGCEMPSKSISSFNLAKDDACAFSWHTDGAQFLFGDGSVVFLQESIDMETYKSLGNIADGGTPAGYR